MRGQRRKLTPACHTDFYIPYRTMVQLAKEAEDKNFAFWLSLYRILPCKGLCTRLLAGRMRKEKRCRLYQREGMQVLAMEEHSFTILESEQYRFHIRFMVSETKQAVLEAKGAAHGEKNRSGA